MNKKIIFTKDAPAPIGPYSQAVQANGFVFVSGQIAIEPISGQLVITDIEVETRQVMENIAAILQENELSLKNIVKTSIFLKNMDDFAEVNRVYGEYFKTEPPARETIQVAKLPKDVNVEISVIAAIQ